CSAWRCCSTRGARGTWTWTWRRSWTRRTPTRAGRRSRGCGRPACRSWTVACRTGRRWSRRCSAMHCAAGSGCCSGSWCSARWAQRSAEGDAAQALPGENASGARHLLAILDWPVAQLMTLAMALVGNFDSVLGAWKDAGGAGFDLSNRFLGAAARASVRSELADEAMDYVEDGIVAPGAIVRQLGELPELRDAMSLVWRILL